MDLISLAILIIVVIAVISIVCWFAGITSFSQVPKPLQVVCYAIVAIVCIVIVARFAGLGNGTVVRI